MIGPIFRRLAASALGCGLCFAWISPAAADTFASGVSQTTPISSQTPLIDSQGNVAPGLRGGGKGSGAGYGLASIRFHANGNLVAGEKAGRVVLFNSVEAGKGVVLETTTGEDLTGRVQYYNDRGLSAVTFDPGWPTKPYLYAFYVSRKKLDGSGDWPANGCPNGSFSCAVDYELDRLTVQWRTVNGASVPYIAKIDPLIDHGWCSSTDSHASGDLVFGPDGYLYVSAGTGDRYDIIDTGSAADYAACGDREAAGYGGGLRGIDALDPQVQHPSLAGKILRLDPATGLGAPDNPQASSTDANRQRIIAVGWRNPFRMSFKPGTSELYVSVVGNNVQETVWRIANPLAGLAVNNAGWPCWEGSNPTYSSGKCANMGGPGSNGRLSPYVKWSHSGYFADEPCPTGSPTSAMGVVFAAQGMPGNLSNALLFADFGRGCLWSKQNDGAQVKFLAQYPRQTIRDLTAGPDGTIYLASFGDGSIRQLHAQAQPTSQPSPPPGPTTTTPTCNLVDLMFGWIFGKKCW